MEGENTRDARDSGDKGGSGDKGDKGDAGVAGDKGGSGDKGDSWDSRESWDSGDKGDKGRDGCGKRWFKNENKRIYYWSNSHFRKWKTWVSSLLRIYLGIRLRVSIELGYI